MSCSATADLASSPPHPGHLAAGKSETGEIGLGLGSPSSSSDRSTSHSGLRVSPTGGVRERPPAKKVPGPGGGHLTVFVRVNMRQNVMKPLFINKMTSSAAWV